MDAYRHITPIERGCIMTLFNQGYSPAAIATMLKRKLRRQQGAGEIRQQA